MKIINLTVLVYGNYCHTSRAFLTYLKNNGYLPIKILQLMDAGSSRAAKLTSSLLGLKFAAYIKEKRDIKNRKKDHEFLSICDELQKLFDYKINLFEDFDFREYCKQFEKFCIKSFYDLSLVTKLQNESNKTFLYTNGGKVKKNLLEIPNAKFIHIHPGIVPYVRGSDGLLWSILTRNKPGASCFYMNSGIDTGELILRKEFNLPEQKLKLSCDNIQKICSSLNFAYDPHLRAATLIDVVKNLSSNGDMSFLPQTIQDETNARTYFKMNPRLRKIAVEKLVL